jgi:bacterioferritin
MSAIFLGLDLAWSSKNPSGAAVLDEHGTLSAETATLRGDDEVLVWVRRHMAATTYLAIDMPTIVTNASGKRPCETALTKAYRKFDAGAHSANLANRCFAGGGRARRLLQQLAADGFVESLEVPSRQAGRFAFEVYPHPAHVELFGLEQIFRYKKKRRPWPKVLAAWSDYREALASLREADPPLDLPVRIPLTVEKAKYKQREDLLDGITCAYLAAYIWRWGCPSERVRVFGDLSTGYIVVPRLRRDSLPIERGYQPSMSSKKTEPFLTDVKELRKRAKEQIDKGAITQNYQGSVDQAIEILQAVLATEIVCVLRYTMHAVTATGIDSDSVKSEFTQHAKDEQEHAMSVAERINQLGGTPNFNPAGLETRAASEYGKATLLVDMIKENLIAERIAVEHYRELIRFFADKDPTTRTMLEGILAVEEEHANDMHDLLVAREGRPMLPSK